MTCFAQSKLMNYGKERCLEYFNPRTERHKENTMINWTNIYLEIFSLIHLDKINQ